MLNGTNARQSFENVDSGASFSASLQMNWIVVYTLMGLTANFSALQIMVS